MFNKNRRKPDPIQNKNVQFEYKGIKYEVLQARTPDPNGQNMGYALNFSLAILNNEGVRALCINNLAIQFIDGGTPAFRSPSKSSSKHENVFRNTVIPFAGEQNDEERDHFIQEILIPKLKEQLPITKEAIARTKSYWTKRPGKVPEDFYND